MDARMGELRRDHLPAELEPLLRAAGVTGTIAVQARQSIAESQWLLEIADRNPFVLGVVGWVDLCAPDVRLRLADLAAHPRFRGVRHVLHDEPDDRFMLRADFRRGIAALREFGLTYDLLIFPRHLPLALELVREFPDQPFIVDHLAKPLVKRRLVSPWREDLAALAREPNVACKLSGLATEAEWRGWRPADFHPYFHAALEAFGADRLMFGSDWPVCTLSGSYTEVAAGVFGWLERFPESVRFAVLGGNAARIYGIRAVEPAPPATPVPA